ncbi:hypothetical protein CLOM_g2000 [Closterium sp. NIES-68]|nr:hypothetical protein CLOM_g2000 [Closterium sp. NIES-68]
MRSSARISDSHFALPRRPHYHSDARIVDTGFEGGLSRRMLFKSPPPLVTVPRAVSYISETVPLFKLLRTHFRRDR